MANSIQAIRQVYDIVRSSRDKDSPLSDDTIQMLLERTVDDKVLIGNYKRFGNLVTAYCYENVTFRKWLFGEEMFRSGGVVAGG